MTTSPDVPAPATLSRTVEIGAPAARVWELVSDLPGMGAFSPENQGGRWTRGAVAPAVGAVFVGRNAAGRRRWSTRCTVTRCEPGRAFAFSVRAGGLPVAEWSYDVEPAGEWCRLTETWHDRRGRLITWLGRLTTGIEDRPAFTVTSIEQTLARVKAHAEQEMADRPRTSAPDGGNKE